MSWRIQPVGDVAVVTMTRARAEKPEWAFFGDVERMCDRLEDEFPNCALVLTGQRDAFASGFETADALALFAREDPDEIRTWVRRYTTTLLRLFTLPRPTIAAINGDAIAGDLLLACACDLRLAVDEGARIGLEELQHGVPLPSVMLELLKHAAGSRAASYATLSGQLLDPQQALAWGLVDELVPRASLRTAAIELARGHTREARPAYATTKHLLQAETLDRMERLSSQLDTALLPALYSGTHSAAQTQVRRGRSTGTQRPPR